MNVPQHIAGHLEDYLDGNLDESGHEILNAWMGESDANCEALAAWFMTEVQLLDASAPSRYACRISRADV